MPFDPTVALINRISALTKLFSARKTQKLTSNLLKETVKKLCGIVMFLLLCTACQAPLSHVKPVLAEEGEVFLYLHPFPQDAIKLSFTLDAISAVRSDGVELPLSLKLSAFNGTDMKRERFVASGLLPPGTYRGFSFKAGKASLQSDEGEKRLGVPEKPEFVDFPFEVRQRKAKLVSLSLKLKESLGTVNSFKPAFVITIPSKPLTTLTGYATNSAANTITVFDKRSGEVLEVIATGQRPRTVLFDRIKMRAYVVIAGEEAVEVIDLLSSDVINRVRLNVGDNPREAAITPDGRTLLVVNEGSNTVSFIDPVTALETSRIIVGKRPVSILIDPAGRKAYVINNLSDAVSVIDIANRAVVGTITTESGPLRGQFSKQGDKFFVFHQWSPNLLVFDTSSLALLKRIYVGMGVSAIKVDPTTGRLFVAKKHDAIVDMYDPFSLLPMDFMKVAGGGASYMLIDDEENNLLLILPDQMVLQSINLISKKERLLVDLGDDPFWATIMGER
jgi:YVTN family beta-propeller protein